MAILSKKESEIFLLLFKDFTSAYNANSISKHLQITSRGALRALKAMDKEEIVIGNRLGKAVFYKINFQNIGAQKLIEMLIYRESKNYLRWVEELRDLFPYVKILILFGSVLKNEKAANDIDVLAVYEKIHNNKIQKIVSEKLTVLSRKIHLIRQTPEDFAKNIQKADKVILGAIRVGIVLNAGEAAEAINGARNLRQVIENFAGTQPGALVP
ncbi:MAG: nucleotidyltransferase domain-containing protein [Candidatus Woesearchaeota archaeon]